MIVVDLSKAKPGAKSYKELIADADRELLQSLSPEERKYRELDAENRKLHARIGRHMSPAEQVGIRLRKEAAELAAAQREHVAEQFRQIVGRKGETAASPESNDGGIFPHDPSTGKHLRFHAETLRTLIPLLTVDAEKVLAIVADDLDAIGRLMGAAEA